MFARLFAAAFVIFLNLTAVNAGILPKVARAVGDLDKRSDAVGNYADPATYAEPITRAESPEPLPDPDA
ncbi:hypothetical protein EV702DRAFT_1203116 [Suillus placidus]|uniref:Uncharacterized protein n=1 Tax=Suillus placidus TaxID=48579 RepID=A0A9P7CYC6_9AGAM|nr:hypothetical protein EV702DRAFT_1203116 [Suillus placidus]